MEDNTQPTPVPSEQSPSAAPTPMPVAPPINQNGGITPSFELFKPSWEAIKLNLGSFLALAFAPVAYFTLLTLFAVGTTSAVGDEAVAPLLLLWLAGIIFAIAVAPGLTYLQVQSVRGKKVAPLDAFKTGLSYFWRYIGLSIVVGIIVGVGFLLFIIPGILLLRRYILSPFYLIDQNLSIGDAMKQSADESKQYSGSIYGIMGVLIVIGLAGIVPILGQLISAVLQLIYSCAPAKRYDEIRSALGGTVAPATAAAPTPPVGPAPINM